MNTLRSIRMALTLITTTAAIALAGCTSDVVDDSNAAEEVVGERAQPILGEDCLGPARISSSTSPHYPADGGYYTNKITKVTKRGYAKVIYYPGSPQMPSTASYDVTGCLCFDVAPSEQSEAQFYYDINGNSKWFQNQEVVTCTP